MEESRKVTLPSGAVLEIQVSPFKVAKALYTAIASESQQMKIDPKAEFDVNFCKDIVCTALSSPKIEAALTECFKRCTYNNLKIDENTFEPVSAREDYLSVCFEIAQDNIKPFTKNLYAQFVGMYQKITKALG